MIHMPGVARPLQRQSARDSGLSGLNVNPNMSKLSKPGPGKNE
nr:hypothetical protein [Paenibacillus sp. GbtcB18]